MGKQTHIFTGMNVAERRFGNIPEDVVLMEIGGMNRGFIDRIIRKYPGIVAYTMRLIHSRNGNHIDARRDNSPIVWIPEREGLLNGILQSSNALSLRGEIEKISETNPDDPVIETLKRKLSEVFSVIRGRIEESLSGNMAITLDNGEAKYKLHSHQRLDNDFRGFPFSR